MDMNAHADPRAIMAVSILKFREIAMFSYHVHISSHNKSLRKRHLCVGFKYKKTFAPDVQSIQEINTLRKLCKADQQ